MKKAAFIIIMGLLSSNLLFSQVAVSTEGHDPDASAILDVSSDTKGILIPRMTIEERDDILSPAEGLMIFCKNCGSKGSLSIYSAGSWQTYSPCICLPITAIANVVLPGLITWNWNAVDGAEGYKWNTTNNFNDAMDVGPELSKTETVSGCGTTFTRYVWAYNTCAVSPVTILSQDIPSNAPDAPSEGVHVPKREYITWYWNAVSGATGYKWSAENNPETAQGMGETTMYWEAPLACGTEFTRYVWAYNGCGYSTPVTLVQSTLECCDPFTINHSASGGVAPVDKTVYYGTVSNIPGEPEKCWITSNLGADHEATAVDDATEASAGWYWQFNRKQGYMFNGSTLTPTWTITSIDEDFDWIAYNDPCRLELGISWHLTTYSEWVNVYNSSGGWYNWDGPWNSGLKLHAAGYIQTNGSTFGGRGIIGVYWSSTQMSNILGLNFYFTVDGFDFVGYQKANGLSVRCLRE